MKVTKHNDIVYGVHAVREGLKSNFGHKLYIQENLKGKTVKLIQRLATKRAIPVSWLSKKLLSKMTGGGVHQGFVLRVSEFSYSDLSSLLKKSEREKNPLILILDGLSDPYNFGAILRTADATDVMGVIIPKRRAVSITSIVSKVSTGAVGHIPIVRVANIKQTLDKLKTAGFWIFGTDMNGIPFNKWDTSGKLVLIVGNEGKGISTNIRNQVDEMVCLPMKGHVQSLNVSVAAGILMYEVLRNKE